MKVVSEMLPLSSDERNSEEQQFREEVLHDYYLCALSREASILSRREVLNGKAKFGISGDGKELAQVAMAKVFEKGDFRSGYYRDQTLMLALGHKLDDYFAQLYADRDNDPYSSGRQMMSHFASAMIDNGHWTSHVEQYNSAADISCTAGQVGRALGLALASQKYRDLDVDNGDFSKNGEEIVFCTIGDGSTSEGAFWETVNAAAVQQLPIAFCVWDDGYSISVPKEYQTVKASISEALGGFERAAGKPGISIYRAKGWNYSELCEVFASAVERIRRTHEPALIHVDEMTQPLGHSTSGSHQRYKDAERLKWEEERDCNKAFEKWILATGLASPDELEAIGEEARTEARMVKKQAWERVRVKPQQVKEQLVGHMQNLESHGMDLQVHRRELQRMQDPTESELLTLGRRIIQRGLIQHHELVSSLSEWVSSRMRSLKDEFRTELYSEGKYAATNVSVVPATYPDEPIMLNGYEVINRFFDKVFDRDQRVLAFGEDLGALGDVNQGFAGLQAKYGEERVFDTGIREWTIIGQAIGLAMRGLRPIAEIQYIDYIYYALAPLTDDLASLSYRSGGRQKAPVIIRSRGHRLEGIWHSGSPMGMLLSSLRGIYILVPRNMTQAAGLYNTALQSHDPVLMVERLNGYRLKEPLPNNLGEFTVPFGVPEVLREGLDITVVTYGSSVPPAMEAADQLSELDIDLEVLDVQTLLPFDLEHRCLTSIMKTNRLIIVDEDVEGGASGFMLQQILEKQGAFKHLDAVPHTITGSNHRPPYGSDGDFVSKPYAEDIFELAYQMMHESDPLSYPLA